MGFWIVVLIGLFVLGSMMSLKPGGVEQRLDKLRMTARRLELNPKLIACPLWIRGKDNEFGRGMIGQYAIILENKKLPEVYCQVIDGQLYPVNVDQLKQQDTSNDNALIPIIKNLSNDNQSYKLAKVPLELPDTIAPFVKAVYAKANSVAIFWEDSAYVKPSSNPNYEPTQIEPDLLSLKQRLTALAELL